MKSRGLISCIIFSALHQILTMSFNGDIGLEIRLEEAKKRRTQCRRSKNIAENSLNGIKRRISELSVNRGNDADNMEFEVELEKLEKLEDAAEETLLEARNNLKAAEKEVDDINSERVRSFDAPSVLGSVKVDLHPPVCSSINNIETFNKY